MVTTISSREFKQRAGEAKKAADYGPVLINDRGRPAYVLLNIEEYKRLTGGHRKIADLLAMPSIEDIELGIPPTRDLAQAADFS